MSHASQRALFSPPVETTQAPKECLFLLNDHTICSVFTQSVPGSLEETDSAPERWEITLHSHWSLVAPFLSQSESLRRDILSESKQTRSVTHLNGEFNNLKPARSSMSKKGMKERSLHEILMLLQRCHQNDKQRKQMSRWGKCQVFNTQFISNGVAVYSLLLQL